MFDTRFGAQGSLSKKEMIIFVPVVAFLLMSINNFLNLYNADRLVLVATFLINRDGESLSLKSLI